MKNLLFITIIFFIGCNCDKKDLIITKIPVKDSVEIQVKNDSIFLSIPYSLKIQNNCYKKIEYPSIYYLQNFEYTKDSNSGQWDNVKEFSFELFNKNRISVNFFIRNYIQAKDFEEFHFYFKNKYSQSDFKQFKFLTQKMLYNKFKSDCPTLFDTIQKNNYLYFHFPKYNNYNEAINLFHKIEW